MKSEVNVERGGRERVYRRHLPQHTVSHQAVILHMGCIVGPFDGSAQLVGESGDVYLSQYSTHCEDSI